MASDLCLLVDLHPVGEQFIYFTADTSCGLRGPARRIAPEAASAVYLPAYRRRGIVALRGCFDRPSRQFALGHGELGAHFLQAGASFTCAEARRRSQVAC
jgi:hypothetical protein